MINFHNTIKKNAYFRPNMVGYPSQENKMDHYLNEYPAGPELEVYPNGASPVQLKISRKL